MHSTTHKHDSAFAPNCGGFALRQRCMPLSMLTQPMAPMTPLHLSESVEASKSARAMQGRMFIEDMQGVFPASVPVVRLADADVSSFAGGFVALLVVAGGLVLTAQNKEEEGSGSLTTSASTPAAATASVLKATATAMKSPEIVAPAPSSKIEVSAASKAALLNKESPKTQEEIAKAYDKAREETQEITRIKNDFIARLEMAGVCVRERDRVCS